MGGKTLHAEKIKASSSFAVRSEKSVDTNEYENIYYMTRFVLIILRSNNF